VFKRYKFEKKFKKSDEYIESIIQYVNLVDNKGQTCLHYAVRNKNMELIKVLLDADANMYIRDYKHRTPLEMINTVKDTS
jgi:ankyrin repeat protein